MHSKTGLPKKWFVENKKGSEKEKKISKNRQWKENKSVEETVKRKIIKMKTEANGKGNVKLKQKEMKR